MTLSTLLLPGKVHLLVSAPVQLEQEFPVYKDFSYNALKFKS